MLLADRAATDAVTMPMAIVPLGPRSPVPVRACCLCGGQSRRMGQDKALLLHPDGGTWLERTLLLLAALEKPLTLFSHQPNHHQLALRLAERGGWVDRLERLLEPEPREGPLLALARLMERHANQRLLLCPVDMPWLQPSTLAALLAAPADATAILVAHDGDRRQPLLGLYPSDGRHRASILTATAAGERGLQRWIATIGFQELELPPETLRNANRPDQAAPLWGATPGAKERP